MKKAVEKTKEFEPGVDVINSQGKLPDFVPLPPDMVESEAGAGASEGEEAEGENLSESEASAPTETEVVEDTEATEDEEDETSNSGNVDNSSADMSQPPTDVQAATGWTKLEVDDPELLGSGSLDASPKSVALGDVHDEENLDLAQMYKLREEQKAEKVQAVHSPEKQGFLRKLMARTWRIL